MSAFTLRHLSNILYREDTLEERIKLLHRWTSEGCSQGKIPLDMFTKLLKQCTQVDLERDLERRYGKAKAQELSNKGIQRQES